MNRIAVPIFQGIAGIFLALNVLVVVRASQLALFDKPNSWVLPLTSALVTFMLFMKYVTTPEAGRGNDNSNSR